MENISLGCGVRASLMLFLIFILSVHLTNASCLCFSARRSVAEHDGESAERSADLSSDVSLSAYMTDRHLT